MKILGLYAENFKKLKAITIAPGDDNIIKITGGNEEGKSTVLESIWAALGGKKYVPDVPVRLGEKKAIVSIDLGDMIVTRKMTANSDSIEVTNKDGAVYKSPQAILDKLINGLSFDPLAFTKMDKQKQVETLIGVTDIQIDDAKLKELGDYPKELIAKNPIDKIKVVYDFVYAERADVNRDLDKAKKHLESLPKVEKVEPVVTVELVTEKERLKTINQENQKKINEFEKAKNALINAQDDAQRIEAELKQAKETLQNVELIFDKLQNDVNQLQDEDLTEINEKIATADETNTKARKFEEYQKVLLDVEECQAESDYKNVKLESIKDYKKELISKTKFPIDGLDFGDDGVAYEGLPFSQASSTRKLIISMAIAAALHPELNVITIDEAEKIDSKHWEVIEKFAKEKDLQVWATIVDTSGKMGIVIEDGEAIANEYLSKVN